MREMERLNILIICFALFCFKFSQNWRRRFSQYIFAIYLMRWREFRGQRETNSNIEKISSNLSLKINYQNKIKDNWINIIESFKSKKTRWISVKSIKLIGLFVGHDFMKLFENFNWTGQLVYKRQRKKCKPNLVKNLKKCLATLRV